ncbi:Cell division control protein 4 [Cladobotryum mycophilum]|uniref:Cell division control protein 4 n=1 Tax=Cladobotryum mycophilum TaxID=491253 RepID=A0ABR0SWP2_9HYPO
MTPSPSPATQQGIEQTRRPRSAQKQTVSVNIAESSSQNGARRFQLEVSECVETKTITTTTRLTRKFPQVFIRDPAPLESLDAKEYPLAMKPPPPELMQFSYKMTADEEETQESYEDVDVDVDEDSDVKLVSDFHDPKLVRCPLGPLDDIRPVADGKKKSVQTKRSSSAKPVLTQETVSNDATTPSRYSRVSSQSPSESYSRKAQLRSSLADSPTIARSSRARSSTLHTISDKLRRSVIQGNGSGSGSSSNSLRHDLNERPARAVSSGFLATPDTTEMTDVAERPSQRRSLHLDRLQSSPDAASGRSKSPPYDAASPAGSDTHTVFSSTSLQNSIRALHHRPTIDVVAAQDASLPSPRLSPTLAAAQLHSADHDQAAQSSFQTSTTDPSSAWMEDSQVMEDIMTEEVSTALARRSDLTDDRKPVVVDTQTLLDVFDSMKTEMKTFMMYQFLRRCPRPTLRVVANTVNPALKCDFLQQLPLELSYHILSYLGHRDLARCAQVSKHWRNIVDRNETGWKELFDRDGYTLPAGELQKAIVQGWGWQDPVGVTGYEQDLSMRSRLTSSEQELTQAIKHDIVTKTRTSKRKRHMNSYVASERSKRRAGTQEVTISRDDKNEMKQHKSAGPLSAANAAVAAVPDPQLGLASLRQLHLYKSLYRRHHMIRQSWTSGEVKPSHVAFAAHPRHVITCLQFDDDKIITGSDDTLIHIYDTKTGKLRKRLEGHEGGVWALQYEGNILVSGSTDRSVRVWDIERGLCQQVFYGHTSTVRCLQILMPTQTGRSSDGTPIMQPEKPLIITGSRDSQLRVWRLPEVGSRRYIQTGPPAQESDCPYFIRVLTGHSHSVRAISAHGDMLVSGSYDSTVRVWRISTGDALHVLHGHTQKVYSVVLDHERNRCISGSMDSLVKIWDLTTGACLYTLEGHSLLVGLLDLRDDRLVSAAADSTLRIWDPETGKCRNTLMAHTGAITCFQHDGRKVISGSEKTVKMWDVRTGECVQDLLTDLSGVWQVKFDGRRCVAAVQRDNLTYVEILDFGAVRDGHPPEELGRRLLLNEGEVRAIIEEEG